MPAVLCRGFIDVQPGDLPDTPSRIQDMVFPPVAENVLHEMARMIGGVLAPKGLAKGIENTIRFINSEGVQANEETWHSHPQFDLSIFFCLRADPHAKVMLVQARDIFEAAPKNIQPILLQAFPYIEGREDFALLQKHGERYVFAREIYHPSKFQGSIEDLDLPDVKGTLEHILKNLRETCPRAGLDWILGHFSEDCGFSIIYQPGDIAIYDEKGTLRYSPSFIPKSKPPHDRWLQSVSLMIE